MPPYAHWTPMTDTTELPMAWPTVELLVHTKPDLTPAPRWSWLARALATFVVFDVVGIAYVAVTSR